MRPLDPATDAARVMILVRDPFATVLSGYNYHITAPELWTKYKMPSRQLASSAPNPASTLWRVIEEGAYRRELIARLRPPAHGTMSYAAYLQSVPEARTNISSNL